MIPSTIQLLGHTWKITLNDGVVIAADGDKCKGLCDFDKMEITLDATLPETLLWHTFMHELMHAILYYMGTKLCTNEAFVDMSGALLAQALSPTLGKALSRRRGGR